MAEGVEDHYTGAAGRQYQEAKRGIPVPALPWVRRLRAEKFQPLVDSRDTVLELGAGQGWNLATLSCARKIATDLENHLPAELREAVEFLESASPVPNDSVDVVICHHVLEHVANPPSMLAEARRILKLGGKLLLHVPYEKEKRYQSYDPNEPNHHLYSWNVQTLGNLAASQGFAITRAEVGEFGYDRFAAAWAVRLRLGETGFRCIRRLAHLFRPGREVRLTCLKNLGGAKP